MALQTGKYEPKREVTVYAWPSPDVNGTEEIWEDQTDPNGNVIGKQKKRNQNGEEVKGYPAPEGFRNVPGSDGRDTYVLFEEGKGPVRDKDGNAVTIQQGQAVVVQPDGTCVTLEDEYAQYVFANAYDLKSSDVDVPDDENEDEDEEEEKASKKAAKKAAPKKAGK